MGIRIHKCLGWGLNDLKKGIDNDPRINTPPIDSDWYSEAKEKLPAFLEWYKENREEAKKIIGWASNDEGWEDYTIQMAKEAIEKKSRLHLFVEDGEFGNPKVCVFLLPNEEFHRYDDTIDYYEAGCVAIPKVRLIPTGIYPFIGMIRKQGSPVEFIENGITIAFPPKMEGSRYNMKIGKWSERQKPTASPECIKQLKQVYRPQIPDFILLFTRFLGIFKDWEKTIQDVKPMIYTYWS